MWYKRDEGLRRITFFFNANTLAGAFGGLLASAISKMNGIRGYSGWRWIFILEGLLTMCLAIPAHYLLLDFPEDSQWLTEDERNYIQERIQSENAMDHPKGLTASLLTYFKDYKSYLGALMYLGQLPYLDYHIES